MERDLARRAIQHGLKILARYFQTGLRFSARRNGLKNPRNRNHFFHPGPKKECEHAHRLSFCTSVNFLMEICVLRPGWNWACNRNNILARWAGRNFSPVWNSPCNQALRKWNRTDFFGEGDYGGSPTGGSLLPCSPPKLPYVPMFLHVFLICSP